MAYVLSTLAYIDISTLTSCLLRNICLKSCSCLQVEIAARYGALGVIIYSDPADYTWPEEDSRKFPDTWWLPPSGAQRGTIFTGVLDLREWQRTNIGICWSSCGLSKKLKLLIKNYNLLHSKCKQVFNKCHKCQLQQYETYLNADKIWVHHLFHAWRNNYVTINLRKLITFIFIILSKWHLNRFEKSLI